MREVYIYNFLKQNGNNGFTAKQIANNVNNLYGTSFSSQQIASTIKNWSSCYGWNVRVDKSQHPYKYVYV